EVTPVVLLQQVNFPAAAGGGQLHDVAHPAAAKGVNALVRVAHVEAVPHENGAVNFHVHVPAVLVFVHQQVVPPAHTRFGVRVGQAGEVGQQGVEVHRAGGTQLFEVGQHGNFGGRL